ncbi:MAG: hypothetical protein ACYCUV_13160, partial [Phycisphaerae bacterium]
MRMLAAEEEAEGRLAPAARGRIAVVGPVVSLMPPALRAAPALAAAEAAVGEATAVVAVAAVVTRPTALAAAVAAVAQKATTAAAVVVGGALGSIYHRAAAMRPLPISRAEQAGPAGRAVQGVIPSAPVPAV